MPTLVDIAKIKVRRGLDSERQQVVLDNGELGFTTDTQRVYVGNGTTLGGIPVSSRYIGSFSTANDAANAGAQKGDFVIINNITYMLIGSDATNLASYFNVSTIAVDDITIGYNVNNQLYVKSIGGFILSSVDTTKGLEVTPANKIAVNPDGTSVTFNGNGEVQVGTINGTQHGSLGGGNLHAVVTQVNDGFMAATDKVKLDNSPDWSVTPLSNTQTGNIINSINSFNSNTITNVAAPTLVNISTNNSASTPVSGNYFLNLQNLYNDAINPGSIIFSSLASAKISNIGELAFWTLNVATMDLSTKAIILGGGDGYFYGYHYNAPASVTNASNVTWINISANNQNALMAAISATDSNKYYSYRVFDVLPDGANIFYVQATYPNYCSYYNNINGTTNITITQNSTGRHAAALEKSITLASTDSATVPISGIPTRLTIQLNASVTGSTIDAANDNRSFVIYDHDYIKHVLYFYNTSTLTPQPSINNNTYFPGTVTRFTKINYTTASSTATLVDAVTGALDNANFNVLSKSGTLITFETSGPGYSLGNRTNYDATIVSTTTTGGDWLASQTNGNGLPALWSLSEFGSDNINSVGTPAIQNIRLPGVSPLTLDIQTGNRNSTVYIKY